MSAEFYLFCPVCGQDRPAELPLCDDAHDDERICLDCGTALFVDPLMVPALPGRAAHAAHAVLAS